jgi:hypothetical protein
MSGCKAWTPTNPTEKTWTDLRICAQATRFMFLIFRKMKSSIGINYGSSLFLSNKRCSKLDVHSLGKTVIVIQRQFSEQDIYGLDKKILVEQKAASDYGENTKQIIVSEKALSNQDVYDIGKKVSLQRIG